MLPPCLATPAVAENGSGREGRAREEAKEEGRGFFGLTCWRWTATTSGAQFGIWDQTEADGLLTVTDTETKQRRGEASVSWWSCIRRVKQPTSQSSTLNCQKYHILMICLCCYKHAMSPSYTTEDAWICCNANISLSMACLKPSSHTYELVFLNVTHNIGQ